MQLPVEVWLNERLVETPSEPFACCYLIQPLSTKKKKKIKK